MTSVTSELPTARTYWATSSARLVPATAAAVLHHGHDGADEQQHAELDDAKASKKAADDARADAERLEQLTETKKQERKDS